MYGSGRRRRRCLSRSVLADRAPVAVGKKTFVVSRLAFDSVGEHRDHVLIGVLVQMMYLVALVEDVGHEVRRRRVDDSGRDNVWHVAEILVFGKFEFGIRVELANSRKMNIAAGVG